MRYKPHTVVRRRAAPRQLTARAERPRKAADDPNWYPIGVKISDAELAAVPLIPHEWHGDWNYTISAHSVVA